MTEMAAYLGRGLRPIAGEKQPGARKEANPEQLREKLLRLKVR